MRIRDPMGEGEEPYNLVPLTDMVFNLLIFFMCATTFAQIEKDVTVQLPQATKFQTLSEAPKLLVINIRQDGTLVVNGKIYASTDLTHLATDFVGENPSAIAEIRADKRAYMMYFANVAQTCQQAGFASARIVYQGDTPK